MTHKTKKKPDSSAQRQNVAASRQPPAPPPPDQEIILLALIGMSPAVLTETLWAMAHADDPLIPHRVFALTTAPGAQAIRHHLFQPLDRFAGKSAWETLREYLASHGHSLEGKLRFGTTSDDIRIITTVDPHHGQSRDLEDIRTRADSEAAGNFVLDMVRSITSNPDTLLIASLAGGRKTMGALLHGCLSLVGRESDRLTHVLVDTPFEILPEFFFPNQPGGPLQDRQDQSFDPSQARVELADVPFVSLRNLFQKEVLRGVGTYTGLVERCRTSIRHQVGENLKLVVETNRPRIEVNGQLLPLSPREHLIMLLLAQRAKQEAPPLGSYAEAGDVIEAFRKDLLHQAPPDNFADWRHNDSLRSPLDPEGQDIRRALSDMRRKIRDLTGDAATLASVLPEKGRFSLDILGSMIQIK